MLAKWNPCPLGRWVRSAGPTVGCSHLPSGGGVQPGVEEPGGEEDGVGGRNLLVFLFGYQELWRKAGFCSGFFFLFICLVQQNEFLFMITFFYQKNFVERSFLKNNFCEPILEPNSISEYFFQKFLP